MLTWTCIPHTLSLNLHLTFDIASTSRQSGIVERIFGTNHHPSFTGKIEIGRSCSQVDLANELTRWVPNLDTITTASIDVAPRIAVDTCDQRL